MNAPPVVLLGGGGNALEIIELLAAVGRACRGVLDDAPQRQGQRILDAPVLGPLASAAEHRDAAFVLAVGSPTSYRRREAILARLNLDDERFATLVHPAAWVSPSARLGPGAVVLANATVGPCATVGAHVLVLPAAVVSHDAEVGRASCLASGACLSGGVSIGRSCYIGANATIIGGVAVGEGVLVGMGAVVRHPVPPGRVVVGNPAHDLRGVRGAEEE